MKLRRETIRTDEKANSDKSKHTGKIAATVVAAVMAASPLVDKPAMAQEPKPPATEEVAPEKTSKTTFWEDIRGVISQPLTFSGSEEAKPEEAARSPSDVPEAKTEDSEEKKHEEPEKTEEKPAEPKPSAEPPRPTPTSFPLDDITEPEEALLEHPEMQYQDASLSTFESAVRIDGRPSRINMDHPLDMGGNVVANEAGSSIYGSARLKLGSKTFKAFLNLSAGNMWFGEQAAPFGSFTAVPVLNVWRLKFLYAGRISGVGNMPSQLYTSHSLGMGYSQPIGKFRIRVGAICGGALSYPAWDDIYLNFATGASVEWDKRLLIYAAPTFYFAAKNPMQTAYVGYYWPRFQDVDMGVQMRIEEYTGRLFARAGVLGETYGARITRTINFSNNIEGDIWVGAGATRWIGDLGGRWDFAAMAGITVVVGGELTNSTNRMKYEHLQDGGVRHAETDVPTNDEPGPYGFGRSGNPLYDAPVNDMKQRMLDASNFQELAEGNPDASEDATLIEARFIGAFMQQVAYNNDAFNAMFNTDFLNPDVKKIASADNNLMFYYLQRYVDWYMNHSPDEPLPADLKGGIAVCAGIHSLLADYLRAHGIKTLVASVNTPKGPHVIAIGQFRDRTVLLDYGNTYTTPANTFDQTMRFYGQNQNAPTFQSQLFNENGYLGTYETAEGRLLHSTIGIPNRVILMRAFLGVR